MTHTISTTDTTPEGETINIVTHYEIIPEAYEPNCESGVIPREWNILKIWYGNTRYNSWEQFYTDYPECAMEIGSILDEEL